MPLADTFDIQEATDSPIPAAVDADPDATVWPLCKVVFGGEDEFRRVTDADPLPVTVAPSTYSTKTVTATASGDNTVHDPASGKAVRLHWFSYGVDPEATDHPTIYLRFGTGIGVGDPIYKVPLNKNGALFARNIGAGRRYIQGAADQTLFAVLDMAQTVHVNIEYEEVTP